MLCAAGVEAPLGSCMVLKEEGSWRPSLGDGGHLTEKPRANVWCVENAGATFLVCSPESGSPDGESCSASAQRSALRKMCLGMSEGLPGNLALRFEQSHSSTSHGRPCRMSLTAYFYGGHGSLEGQRNTLERECGAL